MVNDCKNYNFKQQRRNQMAEQVCIFLCQKYSVATCDVSILFQCFCNTFPSVGLHNTRLIAHCLALIFGVKRSKSKSVVFYTVGWILTTFVVYFPHVLGTCSITFIFVLHFRCMAEVKKVKLSTTIISLSIWTDMPIQTV